MKGFHGKHSEETKRKIREAALRQFRDAPHPRVGTTHTQETKQRIALKNKGINTRNHLYIDGRTKDPVLRSRTKNLWHKRRRDADGTHTPEEWEALKEKYQWTCPSCSRAEPEIKLIHDHIIPLSKGGTDSIENIQPLCASCNLKKHTKTIRY